jgi:beta-RFAP synthase
MKRDIVAPAMPEAAPLLAAPMQVHVHAAGRLHLGFLDPSATLGRRFGSLGLLIDGPATTLHVRRSEEATDRLTATPQATHEIERIAMHLARLRASTGLQGALDLHLESALPAHAGLGSGTQLALAVGRAFASMHGISISTPQLARLLGRGARSGVGIAGFDHGGFIVDGGPAPANSMHATQPAPVLARMDFPIPWRVLLVLDPTRTGLHGDAERSALQALPPFPEAMAAQLCHEVLMRVLPALHEQDFHAFAHGIGNIQHTIASYFAPAQGGAYSSPDVARFLDWIAQHGSAGVGQSSWGPTGFAFFATQAAAEGAWSAAQAAGVVAPHLTVSVVAALNRGAMNQFQSLA